MLRPPSLDGNRAARPVAYPLAAARGTTVLLCTEFCPSGRSLRRPKGTFSYRVASRPSVTGGGLLRARTSTEQDPGDAMALVDLQLTRQGQKAFERMTAVQAVRGKRRGWLQHAAIVVDRRILSSAGIDYEVYPSGLDVANGLIVRMSLSREVAAVLVAILAGGELPTEFAVS